MDKVLAVGDSIVREHNDTLRIWLRAHQIDINDVFLLELGTREMTVHRFRRNSNGQFFLEGEEPAKREDTIRYVTNPPKVLIQ